MIIKINEMVWAELYLTYTHTHFRLSIINNLLHAIIYGGGGGLGVEGLGGLKKRGGGGLFKKLYDNFGIDHLP